nr:uncharacterized protein K02A2.6-like [Dermacentor andersoni]
MPFMKSLETSYESDKIKDSFMLLRASTCVGVKKDGRLRLCGDFLLTVNADTLMEQYPLPRVDDIFVNLKGGEAFSTLDVRNAYNQLPLDEDSKKLAVLNTYRGLYCFNRLAFGVSSAAAIIERRMETVLSGIPEVQVYLDDGLDTGIERTIPAPWPETGQEWSRVHTDYAGTVEGHMLLVIVDAETPSG